ncbi:MAG: hypothetical protein ABL958_10045 [Bdellovibrionia bacterium]
MSNKHTSRLTAKEKALAEEVIRELELDGFKVDFKSETSTLLFTKEFKTVEVLTKLVENKRWGDVRHLFRAVLAPGPQLYVYKAENEWSRGEF